MGSLSEKQEKTYTGVCFKKRASNNIRARASINFALDGANVTLGATVFSPLVTGIEVEKYGSNMNRRTLSYIPKADMPAGRMQEPVMKGRNYKIRNDKTKKVVAKVKTDKKGMLRSGSYQLDKMSE